MLKKNYNVGDKETFELSGLGTFTATVQQIKENGNTLFMFDDYVTSRPMNETNMNEGGYDASDLKKWIDTELFDSFPEEIRKDIFGLTIPSVGMMFGHDYEWCNDTFEPDGDERLELMKLRKNRVAYYNDDLGWGWLRNATKEDVSAANFALVGTYGGAYFSSASTSRGVRPVFWLVSKPEGLYAPKTTIDESLDALRKAMAKSQKTIDDVTQLDDELKDDIERMEHKKQYDNYAREVRDMFDSYITVGFSEEQAMEFVLASFERPVYRKKVQYR